MSNAGGVVFCVAYAALLVATIWGTLKFMGRKEPRDG